MVLYDELTVATEQKKVLFLGVTILNNSQMATQQFCVGNEHRGTLELRILH